MRREFRIAIVAGLISALLACGGGGDGKPAAPTGLFNADAAFTNALDGAALSGLKATDSSRVEYTASLAYTALSDGSFFNTAARRSLQTTTIGRSSAAATVTTVTVFFGTGPARLFGTVSDSGKTTVFSQIEQLPTAAAIGGSGIFAVGTVYEDSALIAPVGTETLSWSIEPDSGATALACLTSVSRTFGTVATEKDCFRIDGAGNISGGTISVERPGIQLNFSH